MKTRTAPLALLLIAYSMFFVMALPNGILNVAWTYMQTDFALTLDSLGVILLAVTSGRLLGTFFSGRVIGRFGVGAFLTAGGLIAVLGLIGYVLSPSWYTLIAAAFVTALGLSTFDAGLNTFVSANYTTGQLNWLHAAYALGMTAGPTLITLIVEGYGQSWHLGYAIVLGAIVLLLFVLIVTRRRWLMPEIERPTATTPKVSARASLMLPAVLLGMGLFFIFNGVVAGTGQLSKTLLTARGIAQAGYWISFFWGFYFLGRLIMGFVAYRLNNVTLIRVCFVGMAIGAALLWQSASDGLNLIGLGLIGLSSAPLFPTLIAETPGRVGVRHRANAIGFQISAAALGSAILPGITGALAERAGVAVIGAFPLVGIIAVAALHEFAVRRRQPLPEAA